MSDSLILYEKLNHVGLIKLNRSHALNALSRNLMLELGDVLGECEEDPEIHCIVLTGSDKAFAAGADIKEMLEQKFEGTNPEHFVTEGWEKLSACKKPVIAAVSGYALGGGCELAMMCDFIIAGESARFSQPEITIGTMPGAGGTQRLPRSIGKAKAMDMCLTGRVITAREAEVAGLVSRVVPDDNVLEQSLEIAHKIAEFSLPIVIKIKDSIKKTFEMPLAEGLKFERQLFHSTFAFEDQKEGMGAFIEKRKPHFKGS